MQINGKPHPSLHSSHSYGSTYAPASLQPACTYRDKAARCTPSRTWDRMLLQGQRATRASKRQTGCCRVLWRTGCASRQRFACLPPLRVRGIGEGCVRPLLFVPASRLCCSWYQADCANISTSAGTLTFKQVSLSVSASLSNGGGAGAPTEGQVYASIRVSPPRRISLYWRLRCAFQALHHRLFFKGNEVPEKKVQEKRYQTSKNGTRKMSQLSYCRIRIQT